VKLKLWFLFRIHFFFQAEDGIRDRNVTGVQTCALPIFGSRNMQNFELLKAVGEVDKPVLLKRGMSATIAEFLYAAEYILSRGNSAVILCERGIRTYETATRNTLDISAVPVLQHETHLPVIVDVTHSTGRRDLLLPVAKAALAIGADGIMAEVHPNPDAALSDAVQQMDLSMFNMFMD